MRGDQIFFMNYHRLLSEWPWLVSKSLTPIAQSSLALALLSHERPTAMIIGTYILNKWRFRIRMYNQNHSHMDNFDFFVYRAIIEQQIVILKFRVCQNSPGIHAYRKYDNQFISLKIVL